MNTTTPLLEYQTKAVHKMLPMRVGGLFMDAGTGKTLVTIEIVRQRLSRLSNVIYFCPVSLKETVRRELLKHTNLTNDDIYVFDDKTDIATITPAMWYIVGIESMSGSQRMMLCANALINERSMVVVDESSYIKGHKSTRTQRITTMAERARYRLILTGTPLSQGVVDLYAQMRFLSWRILGYRSYYSFARNHLEYSDKYPGRIVGSHNVGYLAARVAPYCYQVTKEKCLDLPGKLYTTRWYRMTDDQKEWYERAKWEMYEWAEKHESDWGALAVFRLFGALQQITCGFWNRHFDDGTSELITFPHERLNVFADTVEEIPSSEHVVVWSKYRHNIDEIVAMLSEKYGADAVAQFHGGLSEAARNAEIDRFRRQARFLVATQSSGGHGLTLNEATNHIFFSNGYKYSERSQAEDRSYRIGQTKPVTYIDIVCSGSIDDRIDEALSRKANALRIFRHKIEQIKDKRSAEIRKLVADL